MTQRSRRLDFIDSVRGLAVIMAMLSHAFLQFTDDFGALMSLTRTATPAFVVLFGIMLEIAYLGKLRAGVPVSRIETRLVSRMLTCFLFFAAISLAAFATGKLSPVATVKALVFVGQGFLGVILKIYTVLFLLVLMMLPLLRRYGASILIVVALAGWGLKYAFDGAFPESPYVISFIFGNGEGFGPSILPSVTFMAFGLASGEYLSGKRSPAAAMVMLLLAGGLVGFSLVEADTLSAMRDAWLASRWVNQPLYYAIGICSTSLYLGLFWLLWRRPTTDPLSRFTAEMGQQTLFIYGAGNVALALLPAYGGQDAVRAAVIILVFMVVLLSIAWLRAVRSEWLEKVLFGMPSIYSRAYGAFISRLTSLVHRTLKFAMSST